ncbi:MAG: LPD7 domain-containing protein [Methylococcaceae bacterium]
MANEVQNQDGKELVERIKADLADLHHRFEISDSRFDAKYRFYTAEAVTAKADEIGATRFQERTADGQVSQISKVDGEWKRSDGKSLADIQAEIDKASVKAIEARAEQRAAAGHGVDAETDKQMALVDARDFRRIQNPDWQDKAAEQIAENARVNPNYKAFDAAVAADRVEKNPQENTSQNSVELQRDIAARKAIEQTNDGLMPVPTNELDKATARDLVRDDIAAFSKIENKTERQLAAIAIGHNAKNQVAYQAELQLQNPDIAKEAATEFAKNLRRNNEPQENIIALNERSPEIPNKAAAPDNNQPHTDLELDQIDIKKAKQKQGNTQDIPDTVSSRYLRIEDKYYLPDKTVAFEDRGNKLKLETENHTVIRDALAIAETRGWQSINVSGSQNFKHQVWREASLKGIEVSGYKPTEFQMAEMNHAMTLRDAHKEVGDNQKQQDGVLRGVLLAHGADHYKHDPNQGQSYFVKLDIEGKEVTRWGADLKRAFENSHTKPQIGDTVTLSNTGKQSVEIPNTALDDHGNVIEDKKTVKKNTWQVEKASYQDTLQEQAQALRVGNEIERKVIEQMPQLAAAIAVSKLGEKIAQQAKETGALRSQDEVDTMVNLIREGLAAALEKGKHIKTPEILEQGKHAAIDANSIINDHKPPEIVKEPQQQEMVMTR